MPISFGGGVSPVRQMGPIAPGGVAVWQAEGVLIDGTGSGVDGLVFEAPATGNSYLRNGLSQSWVQGLSRLEAEMLFPPEAPDDGQLYARDGLNRTWVQITGGGGIPEAPLTAGPWARQAGVWTDISIWDAGTY